MANQKYQGEPIKVATGSTVTIELPPEVLRVRMQGLLFERDKAFVLPGAMRGLRGVVGLYQGHPAMAAVVTGHADRVGGDEYNRALSQERAEAIAAYLRDDAEAWMAWYRGKPASQPWGLREDQHMLSAVPDETGTPFYQGPVHGWPDEPTRDAVRRFQASRGLAVDGTPGPGTRRALVEAYMELDGTTLPAEATVALLGCGEHHNAVPTDDGVDEPRNRRVEIFLFDPAQVDPPVPGRCPGAGCPYEAWLKRVSATIDFDQDLCEVLAQVTARQEDGSQLPLAGADVHLRREGFATRSMVSDDRGLAWFQEVVAGRYTIVGEKQHYTTATSEIEARSGGLAPSEAAVQRSSFVGEPAVAPGTGGTPPVQLQLKKDVFRVRWVDEPALKEPAREKAFAWKTDVIHYRRSDGVRKDLGEADHDADGVYQVPAQGSAKLIVEAVERTGPHATPVRYRMRDGKDLEVLPDTTVDLKLSTRVRLSVWVFYPPFMKGLIKQDDASLDEGLLDKFAASRIDDLSLVSTIGWDESGWDVAVKQDKVADFAPRVTWRDFAPGGVTGRAAKYLKRLVDALHARGRQVQAGWASVDKGTSSGTYNRKWTSFLKQASAAQIDALAADAVDFFYRQGIEVDGIGYDFEVNSLGADQAVNLARLYERTAAAIRGRRLDGFVTYANAPFATDGKGQLGFMNVQPYRLARDVPNLFPRPMCFDEHTASPATIRTSVACVLRKATDNDGGGLHPSQIQFGLFARELEKSNQFTALLDDSFRPNRIGVILYQFPQPIIKDQIHNIVDNAPIEKFFTDAAAWDALLNPGEAGPDTDGQPLQVPRKL